MKKTDYEINKWVADWQVSNYNWITDATADCDENYGIDDIRFTATTTNGESVVKYEEVKSIKGGYQIKYGDNFNPYFSTDNPNGIVKKMKFGNTPPPSMHIDDVPYFWEPESFEPSDDEMPNNWRGKHIYFLNAESKNHKVVDSKAFKVYNYNAVVTYIAPDGMITFSPSALRKAFLGYAWYRNKNHTEEFGKNTGPTWELKAVFDLEIGKYINNNPPKELFVK